MTLNPVIRIGIGILFVSAHVTAATETGNEPDTLDKLIGAPKLVMQRMGDLPTFLVHPWSSFHQLFTNSADLPSAITFAIGMLFLGMCVAFVLKVIDKVESSSVLYVYGGTVVLWLFYAMFLHPFLWAFGARRGLMYTLSAYLYTIGLLQPVLVLTFLGLRKVIPGSVDFRERSFQPFGGSAAAGGALVVIAKGRLITSDLAASYQAVASVIILIYLAIAMSAAQRISIVRSTLALFATVLFFAMVQAVPLMASSFGFGQARFIRRVWGG